MKNLKGKKVKELTAAERECLESIISGYYPWEMDDRSLKIGRNKVIIDFENGLSVTGWVVSTEDEVYYELDEDAEIYDPAE